MKKNIPPPENWQDFETLCKKLFGELWGCEHTIKKNGRLGQPQSGVDVYAKPKGETEYFGIQCKGKDNFLSRQLTKTEVDEEIEKAKIFQPALKTYVIATTAPKDVSIEEYVRMKDVESCKSGGFTIVLYSWKDIEDLINENRDTYNWYVNNIEFKQRFDATVTASTGHEGLIVKPGFVKKIKRHEYVDLKLTPELSNKFNMLNLPWLNRPYVSILGGGDVSKAWCKIEVTITNSGSITMEDWKLRLYFPDKVKAVADDFTTNFLHFKEALPFRTTWADKDCKMITCKPLKNAPLIQKDQRTFSCYFKPLHDDPLIGMRWQLLARDFDQEGTITFDNQPQYKEELERIPVENLKDEKEEIVYNEVLIRN